MPARVLIIQQTAIGANVRKGTQGRSVISSSASAQARHVKTAGPVSQAGKASSLAHAQRESRVSHVSRTPGPARPTHVRSTPTAPMSAVITSVTARLGYLVRTATRDTTAIASHARTEAHAMTAREFAGASKVTPAQIALKTSTSARAILVKTVVSV